MLTQLPEAVFNYLDEELEEEEDEEEDDEDEEEKALEDEEDAEDSDDQIYGVSEGKRVHIWFNSILFSGIS